VSRDLRPAQYITSHFRDESYQAITYTGTDNSKPSAENAPNIQNK